MQLHDVESLFLQVDERDVAFPVSQVRLSFQ